MEIFVKYKRIKYLRMKVKEGNIYVSSPFGVPTSKIKHFVDSNMDFVNKEIKRQENVKEKKNIDDLNELIIMGNKYNVILSSSNMLIDNNIYIINEDKRKEIKFLFKNKQLEKFKQLTKYYYGLMNIKKPFPNIIIKDVKSKWGQYNIKKNEITYASELIFKDIIVYDYIVVHELAHMIEFNHSANFYKIVSSILPNYKVLRNKLVKE